MTIDPRGSTPKDVYKAPPIHPSAQHVVKLGDNVSVPIPGLSRTQFARLSGDGGLGEVHGTQSRTVMPPLQRRTVTPRG